MQMGPQYFTADLVTMAAGALMGKGWRWGVRMGAGGANEDDAEEEEKEDEGIKEWENVEERKGCESENVWKRVAVGGK